MFKELKKRPNDSFEDIVKMLKMSVFNKNIFAQNAKEIDIIAECDGKIHPLEVKKSANPDRKEVKKYELIDKASLERSYGGIVCMCETPYPIDELNSFIPSNLI